MVTVKLMNVCKQIIFIMTILALVTSCGIQSKRHRSTSVVQYLYPDKQDYIEVPGIPRLKLPLRVGIAFVPENKVYTQALTEADKMNLMKEVSEHFNQYDFVKSIEIIPSAYLRSDGGFANLDQIKTMYGIDVIALLSYDQTQFTGEEVASITYWTKKNNRQ